jgi:hypothetical protein
MKHITIPLTDEQWRTLKELASLRRLAAKPVASITRIILLEVDSMMRIYHEELKSLRKNAKRKRP